VVPKRLALPAWLSGELERLRSKADGDATVGGELGGQALYAHLHGSVNSAQWFRTRRALVGGRSVNVAHLEIEETELIEAMPRPIRLERPVQIVHLVLVCVLRPGWAYHRATVPAHNQPRLHPIGRYR
jgi:hypothetical protein